MLNTSNQAEKLDALLERAAELMAKVIPTRRVQVYARATDVPPGGHNGKLIIILNTEVWDAHRADEAAN